MGKFRPTFESPIERDFAVAYERVLSSRDPEKDFACWPDFDLIHGADDIINARLSCLNILVAQQPILNYRVDFLLVRFNAVETLEQPEGWEVRRLRCLPRIVVECDGHNYHERTRQQARADKSRDRTLTTLGFMVMRFTGSEINADAEKCAREVDSAFNEFFLAQFQNEGSDHGR